MAFEVANHTVTEEPSPLDRILAEGRSFNGGNWSSDDLRSLLDGVMKYGTKIEAINYIHRNIVKKRSIEEIKAKIDEIREIIKEHKEIILPECYKNKWIEAGHHNITPPPFCQVDPNDDWSSIMGKIVDHHHGSINKTLPSLRDTYETLFENLALESKTHENAVVTKLLTAKATRTDSQNIRWPVIYRFMKACATLEEQMPALNELEAAVVSKVLDTIETEATTTPDTEKSILAGIFSECQQGNYRFCEQDYPPNVMAAVQLFVDPLRTRFHAIPEVASEVELINFTKDNQPSTSSN